MLLLAGLGNPGAKYAGHRHNVGFMAADEIIRRHGLRPARARFNAEVFEGTIAGEKILLLKPQTYMNESGRAVGAALRFYKLEPSDVIVIYDELDLTAGKIRVKRGGGAGGHNGARSLIAHIGQDFRRVRFGIGHPGHKDDVDRHVLGDFAKADRDWRDRALTAIADALPRLVDGDDAGFMNEVSLATQPPRPKKPRDGKTDNAG